MLPLLPIIAIGALILMSGGKKKGNGNGNGTTDNGGDVIVVNGVAELGGVIDMAPGDTLQVNLPDVPGAAWGMIMEDTAGDPQAVTQEGAVDGGPAYRATITPSAVGTIALDFMAMDVNLDAVVTGNQTVLNIV